jgi:hypothetical protein
LANSDASGWPSWATNNANNTSDTVGSSAIFPCCQAACAFRPQPADISRSNKKNLANNVSYRSSPTNIEAIIPAATSHYAAVYTVPTLDMLLNFPGYGDAICASMDIKQNAISHHHHHHHIPHIHKPTGMTHMTPNKPAA